MLRCNEKLILKLDLSLGKGFLKARINSDVGQESAKYRRTLASRPLTLYSMFLFVDFKIACVVFSLVAVLSININA